MLLANNIRARLEANRSLLMKGTDYKQGRVRNPTFRWRFRGLVTQTLCTIDGIEQCGTSVKFTQWTPIRRHTLAARWDGYRMIWQIWCLHVQARWSGGKRVPEDECAECTLSTFRRLHNIHSAGHDGSTMESFVRNSECQEISSNNGEHHWTPKNTRKILVENSSSRKHRRAAENTIGHHWTSSNSDEHRPTLILSPDGTRTE